MSETATEKLTALCTLPATAPVAPVDLNDGAGRAIRLYVRVLYERDYEAFEKVLDAKNHESAGARAVAIAALVLCGEDGIPIVNTDEEKAQLGNMTLGNLLTIGNVAMRVNGLGADDEDDEGN